MKGKGSKEDRDGRGSEGARAMGRARVGRGRERDGERERGREERYDRNVRTDSHNDKGRLDSSAGAKRDRNGSLPVEDDAAKPREKTAAELAEEEAYRAKVCPAVSARNFLCLAFPIGCCEPCHDGGK